MELFKRRNLSVLGVAAVAMFGLAACGGGDEAATDTETTESTTTETTEAMTDEPTEEMTDEGMDPAANLVGPGCEGYAADVPDGAGSVAGMAQDPVATAASNNPLLTQLTAAVSAELNPEVDLVDTLNTAEALTVFAPVDEAFEALDEATVESLSTDADLLSGILTYHVVEGQLAPDEVAGTHTTLNGAELTVEGEGDSITVGADSAAVICGGVQTANATVYLIDSILMPPSE
ncbi:putative surface protein with fasciclin (FAS1) repeats [Arthrobacter pigmenti]|uniref:Putative surface protein with fasciclin (FAS1) repeats n=1 Tax=Arthrobacter pigmenti TaxID=271432 RepID=A0A846RSW0_9MICC|nr:fasciclin domain-containing protein [Arthrobacter pigmenti]NJC22755.1 putative surface protein with fasciclin (FAS1) repeats [Arthrobacter pigmenti]